MRLFARSMPLPDGAPLYAAIVAETRRPDWYAEAGVEDKMDGRFAVLATLMALADVRLDRGGEEAKAVAPRLAECFIADMDAQMREAGFGDPSIGKQVRTMVGALASRVDWWRRAKSGELDWNDAVRLSIYRDEPPESEAAVTYSSEALKRFDEGLGGFSDRAVMEGHIA